jgi:hypothetical protein
LISFRSHVVSLVAVFLALAVGVVLGAGPLQRDESAVGSGTSDAEALAAADQRISELQRGTSFYDSFARATADRLVGGALRQRAVTVVTLPGADPDQVTRAVALVKRSGGTLAARAELTEKLLDVTNRKLVEELTNQLMSSEEQPLPGGKAASGYVRVGQLLSFVLTTQSDRGAPPARGAESVLASLTTADLVTVTGDLQRRGSLVLVVAGDPAGTQDQRRGAGDITAAVTGSLDQGSDGVVVLGPLSSGAKDGILSALRTSPVAEDVSTVDVGDLGAGAVLSVLALRGQANGRTLQLGSSSSADGAFPGAK